MSVLAKLVFCGLLRSMPGDEGTPWADGDMASGVYVSWGDHGSRPILHAARDEAEAAFLLEIDRLDDAVEGWYASSPALGDIP